MELKPERVESPSPKWNSGAQGAQEQSTLNSNSEKL